MTASGIPAPPEYETLAGVREIVVVHSAKGGVGKSTVATNLAVTFARLGMDVALLDGDVHGPSIAHMLGSSEPPGMAVGRPLALPVERHGIAYLSIANVTGDDAPIIWRGPMVSSALTQLLSQVDWGDRDLLLIDLPPGTGDAILGVGQGLTLSGVIAVTTPQQLSVSDTRRGLGAFAQLQVPVLGLVENMAGFTCDDCGERTFPFGEGGGEKMAADLSVPFLGRLPLDPSVVAAGDAGEPAATDPDRPISGAFDSLARAVLAQLALHGRVRAVTFDLDWQSLPNGELRREPPAPPPPGGGPDQAITIWQAGNDLLGVLWGDGQATFHGARELRLGCPCAGCHQEWTGERLPSLDEVPEDVRPTAIRSVGRYAIQPVWSDGHRTGIFSFRDLRAGTGRRNV